MVVGKFSEKQKASVEGAFIWRMIFRVKMFKLNKS